MLTHNYHNYTTFKFIVRLVGKEQAQSVIFRVLCCCSLASCPQEGNIYALVSFDLGPWEVNSAFSVRLCQTLHLNSCAYIFPCCLTVDRPLLHLCTKRQNSVSTLFASLKSWWSSTDGVKGCGDVTQPVIPVMETVSPRRFATLRAAGGEIYKFLLPTDHPGNRLKPTADPCGFVFLLTLINLSPTFGCERESVMKTSPAAYELQSAVFEYETVSQRPLSPDPFRFICLNSICVISAGKLICIYSIWTEPIAPSKELKKRSHLICFDVSTGIRGVYFSPFAYVFLF